MFRYKLLTVSMFALVISAFAATVPLSSTADAMPLVPPYQVKWSQLPDMDQGTDYLSMHRSSGPVVVDDFRSDGRPIFGYHWWGSYFQDDPDLGQDQERIVNFEISFHPDCQPGSTGNGCDSTLNISHPGQPNQTQLVPAQETFFGTTLGGERVYEYWAVLNEPWEETAGEIYWSDIAWAAGQFGTAFNANVWGWHESRDHFQDFAVETVPGVGGNPHVGPWQLVTNINGEVVRTDMAFEVLTIPEPATWTLVALAILGLAVRSRR